MTIMQNKCTVSLNGAIIIFLVSTRLLSQSVYRWPLHIMMEFEWNSNLLGKLIIASLNRSNYFHHLDPLLLLNIFHFSECFPHCFYFLRILNGWIVQSTPMKNIVATHTWQSTTITQKHIRKHEQWRIYCCFVFSINKWLTYLYVWCALHLKCS